MTAEPKIVDKIRRLLALSKSANVHEAANAAAAAQRLMTEYQIGEASLEVAEERPAETISEERLDDQTRGKKVTWLGALASELARANGCQIYWAGARLVVVGPQSGIGVVRYMYAHLTREINRLCTEARDRDPVASVYPRQWSNSFRLGAVREIGDRLHAARDEAIAKEREIAAASARVQGSQNAIVRVETALARIKAHESALKHYMDAKNLRAGRKSGARLQANAYQAGRAAARTINLAGGPALGKGSAGSLRD